MKYVCPLCLIEKNFERVEIPKDEFQSHILKVHNRDVSSELALRVFVATWRPEIVLDGLNTSMLED